MHNVSNAKCESSTAHLVHWETCSLVGLVEHGDIAQPEKLRVVCVCVCERVDRQCLQYLSVVTGHAQLQSSTE